MLCVSGCVKKIDQSPPATTSAENFPEIKAADSFTWSTTKKINFSFIGSSVNEYQLVLKVSDSDGAILFQKLQKANEDYKAIIEVPAHYETLTVNYGSLSEKLDCTNGSVSITID